MTSRTSWKARFESRPSLLRQNSAASCTQDKPDGAPCGKNRFSSEAPTKDEKVARPPPILFDFDVPRALPVRDRPPLTRVGRGAREADPRCG